MIAIAVRAAALCTFVCLPLAASALDFEVSQFRSGQLGMSQDDYTNIRTANIGSIFAIEDFEGFDTVGQIGANRFSVLPTAVGTFTTLGGRGTGTSAIDHLDARGNARGLNVAIRMDDDRNTNAGRKNTSFTTPDDDTYLDSNDTLGFRWVAGVAGAKAFDRLLFTLTDPGDNGRQLTISALDFTETFVIPAQQRNGEIFNVLIGFSTPVTTATLSLAKSGNNDGFSIDNITVGVVPLPAALWLLLGVSGALIAAKRRNAWREA